MYQEFYGLSARPFSLSPDADFLYFSKLHGRAVTHLEYGAMTEAGFIVITGDVGAGKTTIIRHYLKHVKSDVTVGVISNVSAQLGGLMHWIVATFELDRTGKDDVDLYNLFLDFLIKQYGRGKRTVLIIDEAQNLRREVLEELRVLSNVNYGKDQLLQIILAGQPELLEVLQRPDMQQFKQRVAVHIHLEPLRARETAAYIRHRLAVAGSVQEIFDRQALAAIHYFTGGVPRLINLISDQALVYGFSEDAPVITLETIAEIALDRARTGLSAFRDPGPGWVIDTLKERIEPILVEIDAGAK